MQTSKPEVTLKQRVWALIRNKPGLTSRQIIEHFKGENSSSITSILSTLDLNEVIYSKGTGYSIDPKRYFTELTSYVTRGANTQKPARKKAAVTTSAIELVSLDTLPEEDKVTNLLNTLSLNEGHRLYKHLHSMFGSVS